MTKEHVCGLQGFGRGHGSENDRCPACESLPSNDDASWANQSLRTALQNIKDAATKPLHVEIERLERLLAVATRALEASGDNGAALITERDSLRSEQQKWLNWRHDDANTMTHLRSEIGRLRAALERIAHGGVTDCMIAQDIAANAIGGSPGETLSAHVKYSAAWVMENPHRAAFELHRWQSACTGRHGSQMPCVSDMETSGE